MAKKFAGLRDAMPAAHQRSAAERTQRMLEEMALPDLRQAQHLSQEQLAERLETSQSNVSKLERREDTSISTLRSYIRAIGGELELVARFPDKSVRINQFGEREGTVKPNYEPA